MYTGIFIPPGILQYGLKYTSQEFIAFNSVFGKNINSESENVFVLQSIYCTLAREILRLLFPNKTN